MNYPAWQLKKADPAAETSLAGAGCGVLLRRVLAARGCTDPAAAQALLGQGEPLSDPFLLTDMDKAVVRIQEAIENEELMVIYGDYDVDGISATAILYECLTSQGAHVRCKLPTRGSGYGLTRAALESLAGRTARLSARVCPFCRTRCAPACTRFWRVPAAAASPSRRTRSATVWPRA